MRVCLSHTLVYNKIHDVLVHRQQSICGTADAISAEFRTVSPVTETAEAECDNKTTTTIFACCCLLSQCTYYDVDAIAYAKLCICSSADYYQSFVWCFVQAHTFTLMRVVFITFIINNFVIPRMFAPIERTRFPLKPLATASNIRVR